MSDTFEKQLMQREEFFLLQLKEKKTYIQSFQELIYFYYDNNGREFPWRKTTDPYSVFISEVMLQQTQADRVVSKYKSWIERFPNFEILAKASFQEVLSEWQGLGYNRRAKFLHSSAKLSLEQYNGSIPDTLEELVVFPGIGPNTAASISAFAFNKPVVFIETNIRAAYLHFFFKDSEGVYDNELMPIIEKTLDTKNPKEWYNALMDYGTMLKKKYKNPSRKSKHYVTQKPFKGSDREIRGAILKLLVSRPEILMSDMSKLIDKDAARVQKNILNLEREGFLKRKNSYISLVS